MLIPEFVFVGWLLCFLFSASSLAFWSVWTELLPVCLVSGRAGCLHSTLRLEQDNQKGTGLVIGSGDAKAVREWLSLAGGEHAWTCSLLGLW